MRRPQAVRFQPLLGGHATPISASCALVHAPRIDRPAMMRSIVTNVVSDSLPRMFIPLSVGPIRPYGTILPAAGANAYRYMRDESSRQDSPLVVRSVPQLP